MQINIYVFFMQTERAYRLCIVTAYFVQRHLSLTRPLFSLSLFFRWNYKSNYKSIAVINSYMCIVRISQNGTSRAPEWEIAKKRVCVLFPVICVYEFLRALVHFDAAALRLVCCQRYRRCCCCCCCCWSSQVCMNKNTQFQLNRCQFDEKCWSNNKWVARRSTAFCTVTIFRIEFVCIGCWKSTTFTQVQPKFKLIAFLTFFFHSWFFEWMILSVAIFLNERLNRNCKIAGSQLQLQIKTWIGT